MSVYIKGFPLPNNCGACPLRLAWCRERIYMVTRPERCPLVPAADVRPVVKAHWYWDKDGMDWNIGAWRCSACKAMSPMWWNTDRGSPKHKSGHNFCPNCGADMREE